MQIFSLSQSEKKILLFQMRKTLILFLFQFSSSLSFSLSKIVRNDKKSHTEDLILFTYSWAISFSGDVGAIFACVAAGQALSGFATPLYNKIYIAVRITNEKGYREFHFSQVD